MNGIPYLLLCLTTLVNSGRIRWKYDGSGFLPWVVWSRRSQSYLAPDRSWCYGTSWFNEFVPWILRVHKNTWNSWVVYIRILETVDLRFFISISTGWSRTLHYFVRTHGTNAYSFVCIPRRLFISRLSIFQTDGEFYTLFAEEEHETGTPLSTIPRLTTFTNMWHEEFPDVSLRVMKTVSGKDRVAMILKDLIRQTSGKHIAAERCIPQLW